MKSSIEILSRFFELSNRFAGVDLQSRRDWTPRWRARIISNKYSEYRFEAWADTADEAAMNIIDRVEEHDGP